MKAIGLDGREYTAHSLRHTTAATILRNGGQLTDAQNVLRHSNPSTTQIYLSAIKEELRIQSAPEELLDEVF
jgi:integrase/recombinase XerC/integrase/recombinase XerD